VIYHHGVSASGVFALTARASLGVSLATDYLVARHSAIKIDATNRPYEKFVDLSFLLSPTWVLSGGVSHSSKLTLLSGKLLPGDEDPYEWGAGSTVTWRRPHAFLSKVGLGAHRYLGTRRTQYLFSLSLL